MDLLRSNVIVAGLVVPVRSPLHPENCHPGAGTAVSVMFVPEGCGPAGTLLWIAPEPIVERDNVNIGLAANATAEVTSRAGPRWSHESVVGPLAAAGSAEPAIPKSSLAALNRLICPEPGVSRASLSEATMSTTQELAGALMVFTIGPMPGTLILVAAAAGGPGWTPNNDTAPPAALSTSPLKRTAT